jgi:hypothetical protein
MTMLKMDQLTSPKGLLRQMRFQKEIHPSKPHTTMDKDQPNKSPQYLDREDGEPSANIDVDQPE